MNHTKTLLDHWIRRAGMAALEGKYEQFNKWCLECPEDAGLKMIQECEAANPGFDSSQVDFLEFQNTLINELAKLVPESHRQIFLAQVRPN